MSIGNVERAKIYTLITDNAGLSGEYLGQHGVSFFIEVSTENMKKTILFDTGTNAEPIFTNMETLGVDPSSIDMIVLSHNDYDHTGGFIEFLEKIDGEIPVFAHPQLFDTSFRTEPIFQYLGLPASIDSTRTVKQKGGHLILTKDPIRLLPGVFVLGEVKKEDRVDFEQEATANRRKLDQGNVIDDDLEDEIGLGIVTEDGLIVIGGCSHPGIVSIVQKAVNISNVSDILAVIGGFHLINASEQRIMTTIRSFREMGVQRVFTGHCTGLKAEARFLEEWGENFERLHSGSIFEF